MAQDDLSKLIHTVLEVLHHPVLKQFGMVACGIHVGIQGFRDFHSDRVQAMERMEHCGPARVHIISFIILSTQLG